MEDLPTDIPANVFFECSRAFYVNQTPNHYNWSNQLSPSLEHQLPAVKRTHSNETARGAVLDDVISSRHAGTKANIKKSSYSVEELLKKDVPEYTKIPNLLYTMPPCGLLIDKSCTCNLKFVTENL